MSTKGADRQRRYRERMKELGFKQITLTVPTERKAELLKLVAEAREQRLKELGITEDDIGGDKGND